MTDRGAFPILLPTKIGDNPILTLLENLFDAGIFVGKLFANLL
jgi:hypothetical protein